jgi:uncharacterized protein (TIGR03083 family)
MLDLARARAAVMRELGSLIERLDAADEAEWKMTIRCEGWRVLELAMHCASASRAMADALRRMKAGITEQGEKPAAPSPERSAVLETLRAGRAELVEAFGSVTEESLGNAFPLFFVTLPGPYGLQLSVLETGVHRNDLAWALDGEEPLAPDVLEAAAVMVPPIVMFGARRAATIPPAPMAFRLTGDTIGVDVSFRDSWEPVADAALPTCEVTGDDSAITLFALGRIPSDHPSLKVAGNEAQAPRFKTYFPGP